MRESVLPCMAVSMVPGALNLLSELPVRIIYFVLVVLLGKNLQDSFSQAYGVICPCGCVGWRA